MQRISDLHSRSLNTADDAASQRTAQQLEDLVADTSAPSNVLERRINALERQPGSGRDGQIRKQQVRTQSVDRNCYGELMVVKSSRLPW